jgi:membrane fusion protein, heavy metal efflux system
MKQTPLFDLCRPTRGQFIAIASIAIVLNLAPFGTASAAPGAHGPNGEHLDGPTNGTTSGLARLPDGSVQVPMLAQRRMSIRTAIANETESNATVELSGRIVMDPNAGGRVQAVHGGRIDPGPAGLPVAGQAVRKGEVLAYVRHHAEPYALANQQSQLAELRSNRELAAKRVQRLQSLEGTVPRKDIEAARAELQSLSAREQSIGASLGSRETLTAPVAGVIARTDAVAGQIVEARDVLFEVIDPSRVLVEATTADPALPARVGDASLQGVAGVRLKLIGAARSLRDGVLPLTFRAQPDKAGTPMPLAVGQPVTVVASLNERIKGFVLPAQAVVRNSSNEPIVWIKFGAERYIPQPVQYRALDAATVVVTQGLGAENRVVVQGASLIAQIR